MATKATATADVLEEKDSITSLQEELLREQLRGEKFRNQSLETVNKVEEKLEKPRRVIFSIRGIQSDESTFNGAFIPGKSVGHAPFGYSFVLRMDDNDNYVTGLEPELIEMDRNIPEVQKQQLIREVSVARRWLERKYRKSLRGDNLDFWKDKRLKINDLGLVYNTDKNDEHLILYYNILGGGYPDIAVSYDEAIGADKKLYLTVEAEEAERNFSYKKQAIKAMGALEDILDNYKIVDALYFAYYLSKRQHGYTLNTSKEIIVNELADFIEGADTRNDKKKRPQEFLDAVKLFKTDPDRLRISATFNAALYYGYVIADKNRNFVNKMSGFNYGASIDTAINKLLDPTHIEELTWIKSKIVQEKWVN